LDFVPQSAQMRVLLERGFVDNCTHPEALDAAFLAGMVPAYLGFDLTAKTLHVGSMIPLMAARHLRGIATETAKTDAHPAEESLHLVFGDATTRVGDPTDKDGARPILSAQTISENLEGIRACVGSIVTRSFRFHMNSTWLDRMSAIDFITGPARETSLNRLLATDLVRRRIDAQLPMTLMEAIYPTMQAMDFAHLAARCGVRLQIGGSDQWANIVAGVDLTRRMHDIDVFGLTLPLLTDASGRKMGKTAGGRTIWLSEDMTSTFELWQFLRSVPDEKVRQFLGLLTDLPMDEVERLAAGDPNVAKIALATEATAIVHGRDAAEAAASAAPRASAGETEDMDETALAMLPTVACPSDPDRIFVTVVEVMTLGGLASSRNEARRLIEGGGVRLGGVRVEKIDAHLEKTDFARGHAILSVGKKRHLRVLPNDAPPTVRPEKVEIRPHPSGTFDVFGTWRFGSGLEEDLMSSMIPTRDEARKEMVRIRLADAVQ
jgi:tyrosyl-tRNA synthetase